MRRIVALVSLRLAVQLPFAATLVTPACRNNWRPVPGAIAFRGTQIDTPYLLPTGWQTCLLENDEEFSLFQHGEDVDRWAKDCVSTLPDWQEPSGVRSRRWDSGPADILASRCHCRRCRRAVGTAIPDVILADNAKARPPLRY